MNAYVELDLNSIVVDASLARQLPLALAAYYLALPLGRENGRISVAMAYPDNQQARRILSELLQAEIVPLRAAVPAIRQALLAVYEAESPHGRGILAWCGAESAAEWGTAVAQAAQTVAQCWQAPVTTLADPSISLTTALTLAASGQYQLGIYPQLHGHDLTLALAQANNHLFFVRDPHRSHLSFRRILVIMRGFASDEHTLEWLIPLACHQQAKLTLMPLMSGTAMDFAHYHQPDSAAGQHLARCLQPLYTAGVSVDLKFRHGDVRQQVVEEVRGDTYDLLAITAEAEGLFVSQVITAVDEQAIHHGRAIFVLKPPQLSHHLTNLHQHHHGEIAG